MIQISGTAKGIKSLGFEKHLEEFLKNFYGIKGSIIIELEDVQLVPTHLNKWKEYLAKVSMLEEYMDIGDWDDVSSGENILFSDIKDRLKNFSKYESVNMINLFRDSFHKYTKNSIEDVLMKIDNREEFQINYPNKSFLKDLLETLEIFYKRNPKFKFDW